MGGAFQTAFDQEGERLGSFLADLEVIGDDAGDSGVGIVEVEADVADVGRDAEAGGHEEIAGGLPVAQHDFDALRAHPLRESGNERGVRFARTEMQRRDERQLQSILGEITARRVKIVGVLLVNLTHGHADAAVAETVGVLKGGLDRLHLIVGDHRRSRQDESRIDLHGGVARPVDLGQPHVGNNCAHDDAIRPRGVELAFELLGGHLVVSGQREIAGIAHPFGLLLRSAQEITHVGAGVKILRRHAVGQERHARPAQRHAAVAALGGEGEHDGIAPIAEPLGDFPDAFAVGERQPRAVPQGHRDGGEMNPGHAGHVLERNPGGVAFAGCTGGWETGHGVGERRLNRRDRFGSGVENGVRPRPRKRPARRGAVIRSGRPARARRRVTHPFEFKGTSRGPFRGKTWHWRARFKAVPPRGNCRSRGRRGRRWRGRRSRDRASRYRRRGRLRGAGA